MSYITVTIITLNEEENIRECLESVAWADEVVVSDSGSTDSTVEICEEFGARVYSDAWRGFGAQKNLAAERARGEWILNVDADERVSPGLRDEILAAVKKNEPAGYRMPRKNHFAGRWIRRCGWYPDYNLRLYRKDSGRFNERKVHEAVEITGRPGKFKNPLVHYTYTGVDDYLDRMKRYSRLAAEEMHSKGRKARVTDLLFRPPFTFFKMYVLRLGFLDGGAGAALSVLYACYTAAKYARLWEMGRS